MELKTPYEVAQAWSLLQVRVESATEKARRQKIDGMRYMLEGSLNLLEQLERVYKGEKNERH
jgi:hypothetical protein